MIPRVAPARAWRPLFLVAFFLLRSNLHAGRPLVTEDADVAPWRMAQLEVSYDFLSMHPEDHGHTVLFAPALGVVRQVEVSLDVPVLWYRPSFHESYFLGIGDLMLSMKWRFLNQPRSRLRAVLKGALKTATGDAQRGHGTGTTEYAFLLAITRGMGPVRLHGNVGYTLSTNPAGRKASDFGAWGIAVEYRVTPRLSLDLEVRGQKFTRAPRNSHPLAGLAGVSYQATKRLVVDVGLSRSFKTSVDYWYLTLGAAITLN